MGSGWSVVRSGRPGLGTAGVGGGSTLRRVVRRLAARRRMKPSARAMAAFSSRRSTTRSTKPCSSRNSLRWKPSGSFWRIVCPMTRGPANPMSAFGSAMLKSPSIAKLAVTPPVVGSVRSEMYGSRARSSRASAAQIFAICISDSAPSIIRAPPEHETMITGMPPLDRALDRARDLLADDDAHAAADEAVLHRAHDGPRPSMSPVADDEASFRPVAARPALRRCAYGFVSVNCSGSVEIRSASCSCTRRRRTASAAVGGARGGNDAPHLGQTCRLVARSLL